MDLAMDHDTDQWLVNNFPGEQEQQQQPRFAGNLGDPPSLFDQNIEQVVSNPNMYITDVFGIEPSWNSAQDTQSAMDYTVTTKSLDLSKDERHLRCPTLGGIQMTSGANNSAWPESNQDESLTRDSFHLACASHPFETPNSTASASNPFTEAMLGNPVYHNLPCDRHDLDATFDRLPAVSNLLIAECYDGAGSPNRHTSSTMENFAEACSQQGHTHSVGCTQLEASFRPSSSCQITPDKMDEPQRNIVDASVSTKNAHRKERRRNPRILIPPHAKKILEEYYCSITQKPSATDREALSKQIGESPERIKNWFSNARGRRKEKNLGH